MPFDFRKTSHPKISKNQQAKNPADQLIGKQLLSFVIQLLSSYSRAWYSSCS